MKTEEKIPVYVDIENGKTVCICHVSCKGCPKASCAREIVTRDKFAKWQTTRRTNRYGG